MIIPLNSVTMIGSLGFLALEIPSHTLRSHHGQDQVAQGNGAQETRMGGRLGPGQPLGSLHNFQDLGHVDAEIVRHDTLVRGFVNEELDDLQLVGAGFKQYVLFAHRSSNSKRPIFPLVAPSLA